MVTVAEFAEVRGQKPDTISAYIRRNQAEFEGHLGKEKNRMTLDETAVEILDRVYPLPKPVEIVEDKESRQALILMQQKYIELQEKYNEVSTALVESKGQTLLLEQKEVASEAAIEALKEDKDELKAESEGLRKRLEEESAARLEAEKELERLKSRGFFARLFNK